jgi:hypothetical protein
MMYDEQTTVAEAVTAWDKGESVWSVEMGGIGPGYEQAIQVLIFALLREFDGKPLPAEGEWKGWGDAVVHRLNDTCRFSGAQVGAAKNVAARMLKLGYGPALLDMKGHDADRLIQVSQVWPREEAARV